MRTLSIIRYIMIGYMCLTLFLLPGKYDSQHIVFVWIVPTGVFFLLFTKFKSVFLDITRGVIVGLYSFVIHYYWLKAFSDVLSKPIDIITVMLIVSPAVLFLLMMLSYLKHTLRGVSNLALIIMPVALFSLFTIVHVDIGYRNHYLSIIIKPESYVTESLIYYLVLQVLFLINWGLAHIIHDKQAIQCLNNKIYREEA